MVLEEKARDISIDDYTSPIRPATSPLHLYINEPDLINKINYIRFIALRMGKRPAIIIGKYNISTKKIHTQEPCKYRLNELYDKYMSKWPLTYKLVLTSAYNRKNSSNFPCYASSPEAVESLMSFLSSQPLSKNYKKYWIPTPKISNAYLGDLKRNVPEYNDYINEKKHYDMLLKQKPINSNIFNSRVHSAILNTLTALDELNNEKEPNMIIKYDKLSKLIDDLVNQRSMLHDLSLLSDKNRMDDYIIKLNRMEELYIGRLDDLLDDILNVYSPYLISTHDASQLRLLLIQNPHSIFYDPNIVIPDEIIDPTYIMKLRKYITKYALLGKMSKQISELANMLTIHDVLDNGLNGEDLEKLEYQYETISGSIFEQLDNQLKSYEERINLNQYTTNDPYIINIAKTISDQLLRAELKDDYKKCECDNDLNKFCLYRDVDPTIEDLR